MVSAPDERFFLFGFYGQGNLGDDLLLRATIEGIRRIRPRATFVIRNEGPVRGLEDFGGQAELTGIDRILADQSRSKPRRLFETLLAYSRYFLRCRWLVFGGGTVFHERRSAVPLLLLLLICLLARIMGLKIAAIGVGIADLRSTPARLALRAIVSMSALFAVRDDAAFTECIRAGAAKQVKLTGDLVFTLASALTGSRSAQTIDGAKRRVGFSVYPPALLDEMTGPVTFATIRDALTAMLAQGWQVLLMAFHDDPEKANGRQDKDILMRLAESIPLDQQALVSQVTILADAGVIGRAFSEIDLHCGMRFHGHVLAAIFGVPFIGVSTDNKIDAICRLFEMPVFLAGQFAADELVDAVERTVSRKVDMSIREACIAGAERNFIEFARLLAPHSVNA